MKEKSGPEEGESKDSAYVPAAHGPTHVSDFSENIYRLEGRLIRFAGEVKWWFRKAEKDEVIKYYGLQLLRSSGSAALNFGEAQGALTTKDFIHKMGIVHKELRECKVNVRILLYGQVSELLQEMLKETNELMAITAKMILNKQNKSG